MRIVAFRSALAVLSSLQPGAVCAVAGLPGTGKSSQVKAADARGAFPRRVVFDPYRKRDLLEARTRPGMAPWSGQTLTTRELLQAPDVLLCSPLRLVVQPDSLSPAQLGRDFSAIAELCWAAGGIDLVGEEAGLYSREAAELVMRFATGGRHANARLVLITQTVSRLYIEARKNLTHLVCFAQGSPEDLKGIRARCGRSFAEAVRRLPAPVPGGPLSPPCIWRQGDALEAA